MPTRSADHDSLWQRLTRRGQTQPQAPIRPLDGSFRYALIGAGSAARTHLKDVLRKPGAEFVGVVDPAPRRAWRIAGDFDAVPHFVRVEDLLEKVRPHIVSVCTPPAFHRDAAIRALESGAHVICEKPMALDLKQAHQMEHARASRQRQGLVNFSYRNVRAFRYARHLLREGALGRLFRVNAVYLQSYMRATGTCWSWRHDAKVAGYGALGDLGIHLIDGVRFLTGLEFRRATAATQISIKDKPDGSGVIRTITTDTHAMFLAELEEAVLASFETTQGAAGYGNFFRIEISGERGTISVVSEQPDEILRSSAPEPESPAIWKTDLSRTPVPQGFPGHNSPSTPGAIVDALQGGASDYPTFADGLAAQEVLDALSRSIATGKWISIG